VQTTQPFAIQDIAFATRYILDFARLRLLVLAVSAQHAGASPLHAKIGIHLIINIHEPRKLSKPRAGAKTEPGQRAFAWAGLGRARGINEGINVFWLGCGSVAVDGAHLPDRPTRW
jgi:hypothetical protein